MEEHSWRTIHAKATLEATMEMLPLREEQRLGVILTQQDPWEVMMRFYCSLITDLGVGIQSRIAQEGLEGSSLMELTKGLAGILALEKSHIYPPVFIGYRDAAMQILESARGIEQWYVRSVMNLCALFATMKDKGREHNCVLARNVIVFLGSAARVKAIAMKKSVAAAEAQTNNELAQLLLAAHCEVEVPTELSDGI